MSSRHYITIWEFCWALVFFLGSVALPSFLIHRENLYCFRVLFFTMWILSDQLDLIKLILLLETCLVLLLHCEGGVLRAIFLSFFSPTLDNIWTNQRVCGSVSSDQMIFFSLCLSCSFFSADSSLALEEVLQQKLDFSLVWTSVQSWAGLEWFWCLFTLQTQTGPQSFTNISGLQAL